MKVNAHQRVLGGSALFFQIVICWRRLRYPLVWVIHSPQGLPSLFLQLNEKAKHNFVKQFLFDDRRFSLKKTETYFIISKWSRGKFNASKSLFGQDDCWCRLAFDTERLPPYL